ncbi:hypothetical protein EXU85_12850 [Spirosoma sp. KCTC 42546]|uniref:hypothetical protein n=1 Tax=Spirosoma sp. KCTC 42546 TaxID=2520506 RepID=UPI0011578304|nr:hypothetical protein [Spirosoma sp. KCTC 42546]QDK79441.1 hypothetical protein EXU85_12850 [Spirosoma sp. KCTC 42546]
MRTLELHLSEELAASLARVTPDAELFAIEALQARLNEIEREHHLAEEYRFAAEENKIITRDFNELDLDNWDEY